MYAIGLVVEHHIADVNMTRTVSSDNTHLSAIYALYKVSDFHCSSLSWVLQSFCLIHTPTRGIEDSSATSIFHSPWQFVKCSIILSPLHV